MKKTKTQKGITLIALIITIVVLLILAVVAINAVQDGGIISHAKNAQTSYQGAKDNEMSVLDSYVSFLNPWEQDGTTVTRKGNATLTVGDVVTGSLPTGYTWKVLGAENGQLLLMTSDNLNLDGNAETINDTLVLNGLTGWDETTQSYKEQIETLNNKCVELISIEGTNATSVRSVRVEDINRVERYNPSKEASNYGVTVECTLWSFGPKCYKTPMSSISITTGVPSNVNTAYNYSGSSFGLTDTNSNAYKLLFKKSDVNTYDNYWLASSYVHATSTDADFGLRYVGNGLVDRQERQLVENLR